MHVVHVTCNCIAVFLPYVPHTFSFGEETADNAVCVFIGATFAGRVRVAVVKARNQGLNTVCVLELRAVVYGEGFEGALWEAGDDTGEGGDRGGGGLGGGPEDDFKAGPVFGEDQKGLLFASGLAYHAIHFPVPEGRAAVYDQGAAFNAGPLGGLGGFDFPILALLPLGLLPEVLVGYAWDIAFVYVAVEGRRGNGPLVLCLESSYNLVRGFTGEDTGGNRLSVGVIMAQLNGAAFSGGLPICVILGYRGGIAF